MVLYHSSLLPTFLLKIINMLVLYTKHLCIVSGGYILFFCN
nr:MAG TPA: hypothetical protein [Caudoviricetes sp.]